MKKFLLPLFALLLVFVAGCEPSDSKRLYRACNDNDLRAVTALLAKGVNVNASSADGFTALIIAASKGHVEILKILLNAGADTSIQNEHGATALHYAAQNGHVEILKALLDAGADVNIKCELYAGTALIIAASKGHVEIVKALLDSGADANIQNELGNTHTLSDHILGSAGKNKKADTDPGQKEWFQYRNFCPAGVMEE